ncbi:MAG: cation-translocating P-type ATPase [archaeon]
MKWYNKTTEECYHILNTDPKGLTSKGANARLTRYGHNQITEKKPISKIKILLAQIKNPIIYVIIITAIITFIFKKYTDTIVILIVIAFNTIIGFIQEYKAETSLKALKSMVSQQCTVMRQSQKKTDVDTTEVTIDAELLVPGDILRLESGDKIPADGRVIKSVNLEVDESMLTGESLSVKKTSEKLNGTLMVAERKNMVYAGTTITKGRGKAIIVETGMETEIGKIADLIQETENDMSPIQIKVMGLVRILLFIALFSSIFAFLIGLFQGIEIYEMFFFAIASAISAIPEGLPVVMTITLAVGVNRMAKRKAIIRRLQAVDTLGATTIICSDKTGTLTTNQMAARQIYMEDQFIKVTGGVLDLEGVFRTDRGKIDFPKTKTLEFLLYNATLCNNARLEFDGDEKIKNIKGDPTEGALLVLAAKNGFYRGELEKKKPRVDEIPFNSSLKYMVTFHKSHSNQIDVFIKGAPEIILEMCSKIYYDGKTINLTEDKIQEITQDQQLRLMVSAKSVLRNLAFAHQRINANNIERFKRSIEKGEKKFNFIGLVGMVDPPRSGVKESISLCERAGIKVIMATGDHKITAEAIAKEIGIHKEEDLIITGKELKSMNREALDEKIENTSVFARVSPKDKFEIVSSLKRKENVVCMTGDGVNDAPALNAADVGVSMGETGTDVAKEASEMVLSDDDFSSIVHAVEEGRVVFENIRKVIKYLICTNIGEDAVILVSLLLFPLIFNDLFLIFTPVQILWVNLVTDGVLDITLAMERRESDVMSYPPRSPDEPILNRNIFLNIIFISFLMMFGTLAIFLYGMGMGYNLIRAQTVAFTTMAMFQIFNSLNCRSSDKSVFELGFFSNKYLIGAIMVSILFQFAAVYLLAFNFLLGTTPIPILDWLIIILISSSVLVADEIRKLILKYRKGDS